MNCLNSEGKKNRHTCICTCIHNIIQKAYMYVQLLYKHDHGHVHVHCACAQYLVSWSELSETT